MNNEISIGKRIKDLLARKTLPTVLAGSMLFSGAFVNEVQAYSLDEPSQSYEDFLNYDGIKVFINGRYVEFTESTGFPFVENGSTMIPLRAVSETFGAKVNWNSYSNTASVSKYDINVDVIVDGKEMKVKDLKDGSVNTVSVTKEAVVRDGRTYIPLRSLFECFGLNVKWDSEKKIAHIETISLDSLEFIDFKEDKVYSIKELIKMNDINKFIYDGEVINKNYLSVLENSNQFVVTLDKGNAYIFSYQFLSNLNYYYGKEKVIKKRSMYESDEKVLFKEDDDTLSFIKQLMWFNNYNNLVLVTKSRDIYSYSYGLLVEDQFSEMINEAKRIGEEIKNKTNNRKEQAILLTDYLNRNISYNKKQIGKGAYSALVEKSAVCGGYAVSYKLVSDYLGIPCIYVTGNISSGFHAWNEVYIDGKWYIFDATLNIKMYDIDGEKYSPSFDGFEDYVESKELVKLTYKFNE